NDDCRCKVGMKFLQYNNLKQCLYLSPKQCKLIGMEYTTNGTCICKAPSKLNQEQTGCISEKTSFCSTKVIGLNICLVIGLAIGAFFLIVICCLCAFFKTIFCCLQ